MLHDILIHLADLALGTTVASAGAELMFLVIGILISLLILWLSIRLADWLLLDQMFSLSVGMTLGLILGLTLSLLVASVPNIHNQRFSQCDTQKVSYKNKPATETWCSTRTDLTDDFGNLTLTEIELDTDNGH